MGLIGFLLGAFLFITVVVVGLFLFAIVFGWFLLCGTIFGLVRGFFFMGQALITDVLGIGNL